MKKMKVFLQYLAQEKYNDKFYFRKNPVYKVENSLLIKWVLIESCGFYSETDLTHYCIVTGCCRHNFYV